MNSNASGTDGSCCSAGDQEHIINPRVMPPIAMATEKVETVNFKRTINVDGDTETDWKTSTCVCVCV